MLKIKKHQNKIPDHLIDEVSLDICKLRSLTSEEKYQKKLSMIIQKWKKKTGKNSLKEFTKYFINQWVDSPFNKWQLFQTPQGFAMTNSPIESYNSTIKKFFTNRKKYHLVPICEIFERELVFESKILRNIHRCVPVKVSLLKEAKQKINQEKIEKLESEDENIDKFIFNHLSENKKKIQFNVEFNAECVCSECCFCDCIQFLDKGVCLHLAACCFKYKLNYPGVLAAKYFVQKSTSRKRKIGKALEYD